MLRLLEKVKKSTTILIGRSAGKHRKHIILPIWRNPENTSSGGGPPIPGSILQNIEPNVPYLLKKSVKSAAEKQNTGITLTIISP